MASIVVIKRNGTDGQTYKLDERQWCTIGSHPECDIIVHASGVAKLHALVHIARQTSDARLYGLDEHLPTVVPAQKKTLYTDDTTVIEANDIFFVGERSFRFEWATRHPGVDLGLDAFKTPTKATRSPRFPDSDSLRSGRNSASHDSRRRRSSLLVKDHSEEFVASAPRGAVLKGRRASFQAAGIHDADLVEAHGLDSQCSTPGRKALTEPRNPPEGQAMETLCENHDPSQVPHAQTPKLEEGISRHAQDRVLLSVNINQHPATPQAQVFRTADIKKSDIKRSRTGLSERGSGRTDSSPFRDRETRTPSSGPSHRRPSEIPALAGRTGGAPRSCDSRARATTLAKNRTGSSTCVRPKTSDSRTPSDTRCAVSTPRRAKPANMHVPEQERQHAQDRLTTPKRVRQPEPFQTHRPPKRLRPLSEQKPSARVATPQRSKPRNGNLLQQSLSAPRRNGPVSSSPGLGVRQSGSSAPSTPKRVDPRPHSGLGLGDRNTPTGQGAAKVFDNGESFLEAKASGAKSPGDAAQRAVENVLPSPSVAHSARGGAIDHHEPLSNIPPLDAEHTPSGPQAGSLTTKDATELPKSQDLPRERAVESRLKPIPVPSPSPRVRTGSVEGLARRTNEAKSLAEFQTPPPPPKHRSGRVPQTAYAIRNPPIGKNRNEKRARERQSTGAPKHVLFADHLGASIELESGPHYSPTIKKRKSPPLRTELSLLRAKTESAALEDNKLPRPSPAVELSEDDEDPFVRRKAEHVLGPPPSTPLAKLGQFLYSTRPRFPLLKAPPMEGSSPDGDSPKCHTVSTTAAPSGRRTSAVGVSPLEAVADVAGALATRIRDSLGGQPTTSESAMHLPSPPRRDSDAFRTPAHDEQDYLTPQRDGDKEIEFKPSGAKIPLTFDGHGESESCSSVSPPNDRRESILSRALSAAATPLRAVFGSESSGDSEDQNEPSEALNAGASHETPSTAPRESRVGEESISVKQIVSAQKTLERIVSTSGQRASRLSECEAENDSPSSARAPNGSTPRRSRESIPRPQGLEGSATNIQALQSDGNAAGWVSSSPDGILMPGDRAEIRASRDSCQKVAQTHSPCEDHRESVGVDQSTMVRTESIPPRDTSGATSRVPDKTKLDEEIAKCGMEATQDPGTVTPDSEPDKHSQQTADTAEEHNSEQEPVPSNVFQNDASSYDAPASFESPAAPVSCSSAQKSEADASLCLSVDLTFSDVDEIRKLRVKDLQKVLKKLGLEQRGRKDELIQRLHAHYSQLTTETPTAAVGEGKDETSDDCEETEIKSRTAEPADVVGGETDREHSDSATKLPEQDSGKTSAEGNEQESQTAEDCDPAATPVADESSEGATVIDPSSGTGHEDQSDSKPEADAETNAEDRKDVLGLPASSQVFELLLGQTVARQLLSDVTLRGQSYSGLFSSFPCAKLRVALSGIGENAQGRKADLIGRLETAFCERYSHLEEQSCATDSNKGPSRRRRSTRLQADRDSQASDASGAGRRRRGERQARGDVDYASLTVVELRVELRRRGLSRTGNKQELVDRLKTAS